MKLVEVLLLFVGCVVVICAFIMLFTVFGEIRRKLQAKRLLVKELSRNARIMSFSGIYDNRSLNAVAESIKSIAIKNLIADDIFEGLYRTKGRWNTDYIKDVFHKAKNLT